MTPTGSTEGTSVRESWRSSSYSRCATLSPISFTAITRPESFTNRTTCRERPRGSAASTSSAHSSTRMSHGSVRSAGSGEAAALC